MGATSAADEGMPIGSILDGRYRIDAVLGTGGMGKVYKGEHTSLGRTVAIKVLHADLGRNREAAARFQREALASGRLDHPNIVGVSDFGVLADGALYLVMEALEGESVGDRLEREQRIPWIEAVQITRAVLSGLKHAHDRGVVHRDIKPDNVFLARKDGEQVVKILDFGIAKLYAGDAADPASTRAGLTVGTPAYLSPEQAVGGEITPASDVYSTSIVLYEMLTGRPPYDDKDPLTMLTAHVTREPPPIREVAPDLTLPMGLEAVIKKGLEKVWKQRISGTDYIRALDEVLRDAGYLVTPARASGPHVIPTPIPGSLSAPVVTAVTPVAAASGPTISPLPAATRPVTLGHPGEPIPRKWLVMSAGVLGLAVLIALVLVIRNRLGGNADARLKSLVHDLESGASCEDRREAVGKLVDLGDDRAIPALKRARYRMRGGLVGIGDSNTNACLKDDAEAAIKKLSE
jgi:serine/threonine protein kinase